MFRVVIHRRARHYLERLPGEMRTRIHETLRSFKHGVSHIPDVKKMVGNWAGYYRTRVGDIRIIFWIDMSAHIIYIDHIGPRGDIYK